MTKAPVGNEMARPFLPAKDFEMSKRFYEALGFAKVLDGEVAIFETGPGSSFILQNYYVQAWAENFMMQLWVDDLDAWWAHIQTIDFAGFGVGFERRAPALQPWGLRIAYIADPSGVLWHVVQRVSGERD